MEKKASPFGPTRDHHFMEQALEQARKAFEQDEVPVGAVIVDAQGTIVAQAYNRVESDYSQHAHAESLALVVASKGLKNWRLEGHWVYVTLEPCSMCMHFMLLSRCAGVVFAAPSVVFGYHLDKPEAFQVYKKNAFSVVKGVCDTQAADLLKQFFQQQRKKKGE